MKLLYFLRQIKKSFTRYRPSVEIFISKDNLLHNLNEYRSKYLRLAFAPVLKSNAYGHGLVPIAHILDTANIPFFVLDSLYEAMILRNEGVRSKILIIGYTAAENIKSTALRGVAFTITSLAQLQEVAHMRIPVTLHLKIDTGMHRQGILSDEIEEAIDIIKKHPPLSLEGVCSHFADADASDETYTKAQIDLWEKAVVLFQKNFPKIQYFHISATAGTTYAKQTSGNVIRLGLGLYGIRPAPSTEIDLYPVLSLQSLVSSIKHLPAGKHIGYNITYQTQRPSIIATVPVGYFEGVDRRLSNIGCFTLHDTPCPIVGRVSMNITTIDATAAPHIKLGDKVTIISNNKEENNSVERMAAIADTIPYEILVHIPPHLRRTIEH